MSVQERRNRTSLKFLRSRFVRRAEGLLRGSAEFKLEMRSLRAEWNKRFPEYAITVSVIADDASPEDFFTLRNYFYPKSLARDVREMTWPELLEGRDIKQARAHLERNDKINNANYLWTNLVGSIRDRMFPPNWFPVMTQWPQDHPANPIASACVLFDVRTVEPDLLLPEFTLKPMYLHYPPLPTYEMSELYRAIGERDCLQEQLNALLTDDPERLKDINQEVWRVGSLEQHERMPHGLFVPNPADWWWYLPITSETRSEDVRSAATSLVELTHQAFGNAPLDRLILQMQEKGKSQMQISRLLGVSKDTVKRAWRSNREQSKE